MAGCDVSNSGTRLKENGTWRKGLHRKRLKILEARAGVGHGGIDVKRESIREETIKRCLCHGEIHTWMKQISVEIIK